MSKTVLVVDNNQLVRLIVSEMLESSGFEVMQAADGIEALQIVNASPPDLIISDCHMPKMDGPDFVKRLRSSCKLMPVLALAGTRAAEIDMMNAGSTSFLDKPIDRPRLVSNVCALLHIPMHNEPVHK